MHLVTCAEYTDHGTVRQHARCEESRNERRIQQSLGDPVAIIAAAEAIIGLLIEISFIATFTQRFFGR
jgi:hypothetical protein